MIRSRSTSEQGQEIRALMNSLAVAIHERSSQTSELANHGGDNSTTASIRLTNSQPEIAAAAS